MNAWDHGVTWFPSVVTAPTDLPIPVSEVRTDELRLPNGSVEDKAIARRLWAALRMAEHATQRAIAPQTLRISLSGFPCWQIQLPRPPLIEVESVTYLDGNGDWQTLTVDTDYVVTNPLGPTARQASIEPAHGTTWPVTQEAREAVKVTYRAGYVSGSPEDVDVPEDLISAMLLLVGELHKQRSESVQLPNNTSAVLRAHHIFEGYRVY